VRRAFLAPPVSACWRSCQRPSIAREAENESFKTSRDGNGAGSQPIFAICAHNTSDTNVMMLLSNPHLQRQTVTSPVETMQVAPTILQALGLHPYVLQSVVAEGTQVLPGIFY
jgi:hypothetical protein